MCLSGWGERWRQVLPWLLGSGMDKARGHLAWGFLRSKWTSEQENQSTLVSALPKFCGFEALKIILLSQPHNRTDAEAEAPILWPTDTNNRLIGKDPDARKD